MEKERMYSENGENTAEFVQEAAEISQGKSWGYSENGENVAAPAFDSPEEELAYYEKQKEQQDNTVHTFSENG